MTKIRLANGTILDATNVELKNGVLSLTVSNDISVEELAQLFRNKINTALITLMTENKIETGYKRGFTSFAGINYHVDGTKTVELFQPKDVTEARLADVEGKLVQANEAMNAAAESATTLEMSILDTQLAIAELAEMMMAAEDEVVEETEAPEAPTEGGNE